MSSFNICFKLKKSKAILQETVSSSNGNNMRLGKPEIKETNKSDTDKLKNI